MLNQNILSDTEPLSPLFQSLLQPSKCCFYQVYFRVTTKLTTEAKELIGARELNRTPKYDTSNYCEGNSNVIVWPW